MAQIVLSCQHQFEKTDVKLRDALKSRGFTTCFHEDNADGVSHEEMEKEIENASVVIMCMSAPYQASENCKKEIECAERLEKPIIPILVQYGFEPSEWLALASGSKMVIDFSDTKKFNESFEQLLKELTTKKIKPNAVDSNGGAIHENGDGILQYLCLCISRGREKVGVIVDSPGEGVPDAGGANSQPGEGLPEEGVPDAGEAGEGGQQDACTLLCVCLNQCLFDGSANDGDGANHDRGADNNGYGGGGYGGGGYGGGGYGGGGYGYGGYGGGDYGGGDYY